MALRATLGQLEVALEESARSLGLESSGFRLLASLLAGVAASASIDIEAIAEVGRVQGRATGAARARAGTESCLEALVDELADLGFDPAVGEDARIIGLYYVRNPEKLAATAAARKPTMMLLPYGIPLAVGSIAYFAFAGLMF